MGEDRRRAPADAAFGPVVVTGFVAVALVTVVASAVPEPSVPFDAGLVLDTVAAVCALAVFALCRARWGLVGASAPLWGGTGALALGVAGIALPNILGPVLAGHATVADSTLQEAGLWAAVIGLALAALAPPVDTRLRPVLLAAGAAVVVAVVAALIDVVPALGHEATVALAAAAVGAVHARRSAARQWLHGWCAVLALGVVAGQLASGTAAHVAQAVALAVVVVACALELARDYVDQRTRLFYSELIIEATALGERAEEAGRRQRRHDVRNAVLAIEGSAVTLERYLDRLSAGDRASLTTALSSGVERLQRLLGEETGTDATVDLSGLAAVEAAQQAGVARERLVVDVPAGLVATGSTQLAAEVLRLLLDNARRRAPGEAIVLEGRREGSWMVLQVRDRGTPIGRGERRSLASADMGLLVAARLMHDQGGDLWVESHPAGGAFSLCLPAATQAAGADDRTAEAGLGA